jgi:hypothetical protein
MLADCVYNYGFWSGLSRSTARFIGLREVAGRIGVNCSCILRVCGLSRWPWGVVLLRALVRIVLMRKARVQSAQGKILLLTAALLPSDNSPALPSYPRKLFILKPTPPSSLFVDLRATNQPSVHYQHQNPLSRRLSTDAPSSTNYPKRIVTLLGKSTRFFPQRRRACTSTTESSVTI